MCRDSECATEYCRAPFCQNKFCQCKRRVTVSWYNLIFITLVTMQPCCHHTHTRAPDNSPLSGYRLANPHLERESPLPKGLKCWIQHSSAHYQLPTLQEKTLFYQQNNKSIACVKTAVGPCVSRMCCVCSSGSGVLTDGTLGQSPVHFRLPPLR